VGSCFWLASVYSGVISGSIPRQGAPDNLLDLQTACGGGQEEDEKAGAIGTDGVFVRVRAHELGSVIGYLP